MAHRTSELLLSLLLACGPPPPPVEPPPPTVAIPEERPPSPLVSRTRVDVVIDGEKHVDAGEIEGVDEMHVFVTRRADGGADVVLDGHGDAESADWWLARVSRGVRGAIPPLHVEKREGGRFHLETSLDATQAGLW